MINHIESLQIETYRGIRKLQIENLGNVNVLVGDNNAGKTSVLEAIQLICSPSEYTLVQIARQREKYRASIRMGIGILDSVLYMFDVTARSQEENNYNISVGGAINKEIGKVSVTGKVVEQIIDLKEIAKYSVNARNKLAHSIVDDQEETRVFIGKIESTFKNYQQPTLFDKEISSFEISDYTRVIRSLNEDCLLNVNSVQTIDHIIENAFNRLLKNNEIKEKAVELLRKFDENANDIRYINDDNRFVPIIESVNGEYIPLSLYGDGMKKALTMLNAIVNTENGVVLIDEFETALHISAMSQVFRFILDASKELNVQLFLTTHNIEAVDKLLECAGDDVGDIRVIRLKKKDGITLANVTNGKDALEDRREYNMELRI